MSPTIKIVIVLLPFIIAGYVGFSMLQPSMEEASTKDATVSEKKTELTQLQTRLGDPAKVSARMKSLEDDIKSLRGAVPSSPDMDLFTIDLERMCKEAGMDLIAVNSVKVGGAPVDQSANLKKKQDKLKNVLKGGAGEDPDKAGAGESEPPSSELETSDKQILVTGDYNGLQKLVHELETYQRVIKINEIVSRVPKATAGKEKEVKLPDDSALSTSDTLGDPNMLYISMNISTYYLP